MSTFTASHPGHRRAPTPPQSPPPQQRRRPPADASFGTRIAGIGGLAFIANRPWSTTCCEARSRRTTPRRRTWRRSTPSTTYSRACSRPSTRSAWSASRSSSPASSAVPCPDPGGCRRSSGLVGSAGVVGGFSTLLAFDSAIAGYLHRGGTSTDVVEGLWVTHSAVFGVLLGSIAVALAGPASAAVSRWSARPGAGGRSRWPVPPCCSPVRRRPP